jgi:hypothetical protein
MDRASLEAKKQQYSQRFDELNRVVDEARNEQQQLTGAYNLCEELINNLTAKAQSKKTGKDEDGPNSATDL